MARLRLQDAQDLAQAFFDEAHEAGLKPMTVVVLDEAGQITVLLKEDRSALMRADIAIAKANAALGMGLSTEAMETRFKDRPGFVASLSAIAMGRFTAVAGGIRLFDGDGDMVGAVGVTGDNDALGVKCLNTALAATNFTTDDD